MNVGEALLQGGIQDGDEAAWVAQGLSRGISRLERVLEEELKLAQEKITITASTGELPPWRKELPMRSFPNKRPVPPRR